MGRTDTQIEPHQPVPVVERRGDPLPKRSKFVWPPRPMVGPLADDLEGVADDAPAPIALDLPRTPWEQFEHEWLGVNTPPLQRRLAEAGVAPDPLNAFCWRCARTVGPYETDSAGCASCRGTRTQWSRFVRLAEYAQPWSRIVLDAKFTRWPRLSVDLGRLLGRQLAAALPDIGDRPTIVVPVPTNYFRRLWRGTDHSLNLARGVSRELHVPLRTMLTRARRPEQARLSATDRLTNLRDSMRRSPLDPVWATLRWSDGSRWPAGSPSARMILVDDISTTGATMGESCRAARRIAKSLNIQDLEIVAATVCRTEERR